MTKEMDPNLSPETIKELMGDDVRQYRQRNKKANVIEIVKASNHYHLPVEEHLRLLNLNDPDNEYSAIPEDPCLEEVFEKYTYVLIVDRV